MIRLDGAVGLELQPIESKGQNGHDRWEKNVVTLHAPSRLQ
jgi:hypothetical protein